MIADVPDALEQRFAALDRRRFRRLLSSSRSRVLRPLARFAEEEIILPTGPAEDLKFRLDRQPFARLLYEQFENPHWYEYAVTGNTQAGKSLLAFAIPCVWKLCECEEDVIVAAPIKEILEDKVRRDILPLIERSRYRNILPRRGGGAKGGIPDRFDFANGTTLKLMSFEGRDKSKASFTCPNLIMTEVNEARAAATSSEGNPLEQIIARATATPRDKRFVVYECTVDFEDGHIWRLVHDIGSAGRLMLPCCKCRAWVCPDRPDLRGWERAETEIEAERLSRWHCPACKEPWDDSERYEMNLQAKLLHKGQSIDDAGKISGELPETRTLGFRFGPVNSTFTPASDLGVKCWKTRQNEDDEVDGEKALCQFYFCNPFRPPGLEVVKIDRQQVEKRTMDYPRGMVPKSTQWITIGADVGKRYSWWVAIAWLMPERFGLVFDYGRITMRYAIDEESKVWVGADETGFENVFDHCVGSWKAEVDQGWPRPDGTTAHYNALWMDSRYQGGDEQDDDVVYSAIKGWRDKRVLPVMGHASTSFRKTKYRLPARDVMKRGNHYDVRWVAKIKSARAHIDCDKWITITQRRYLRARGQPGGLYLFSSKNPREHAVYVKHLEAVLRKRDFVPGKGMRETYSQSRVDDHLGDCTIYASAAAHYCDFRVGDPVKKKAKPGTMVAPILGPGGRPFVASQR